MTVYQELADRARATSIAKTYLYAYVQPAIIDHLSKYLEAAPERLIVEFDAVKCDMDSVDYTCRAAVNLTVIGEVAPVRFNLNPFKVQLTCDGTQVSTRLLYSGAPGPYGLKEGAVLDGFFRELVNDSADACLLRV